eukprot:UN1464
MHASPNSPDQPASCIRQKNLGPHRTLEPTGAFLQKKQRRCYLGDSADTREGGFGQSMSRMLESELDPEGTLELGESHVCGAEPSVWCGAAGPLSIPNADHEGGAGVASVLQVARRHDEGLHIGGRLPKAVRSLVVDHALHDEVLHVASATNGTHAHGLFVG